MMILRWPWQSDPGKVTATRDIEERTDRLLADLDAALEHLDAKVQAKENANRNGRENSSRGGEHRRRVEAGDPPARRAGRGATP